MEAEAVRMVTNLFAGSSNACGVSWTSFKTPQITQLLFSQ